MKWIIFSLFVALIVIGCSSEPTSEMDSMPCHQMPDGSWMGDCTDEDVNSHSMDDMPCHQMPDGSWMGKCDDMDAMEDEADLAPAQESEEIDLGDEYELSADRVLFMDGVGYGYNGQIPGPTLHAAKDQRSVLTFRNTIGEPTTVHWHGLRHDVKDDGMPGVSQPEVESGGSYLYNLYFPDEGLFWYHPHVREDRQQDLGLAGLIRVGESQYEEEYLVLDDVLIADGKNVAYGEDHANFALMGRYGNTLLVNGKDSFATTMETGEIRRFFFANVANARPFRLSFEGAQMKAVGGDLGVYAQQKIVDHVIIAPAERVSVDVQFLEEGTFSIVHESADENYVLGQIDVVPGDDVMDFSLQEDEFVRDEIESFREYFDMEPTYELTLTVETDMMAEMPCHQMGEVWMGDCDFDALEADGLLEHGEHAEGIEWEDDMGHMNAISTTDSVEWQLVDQDGNVNMDIMMKARVGDVVKIRFLNTLKSAHPMQHPIHLHGQRFLVTAIDGEEPELMGWEDTVLVPTGETVDVLVDVTNPGEWMIHCHIAEHLEAGMMAHFMVEA